MDPNRCRVPLSLLQLFVGMILILIFAEVLGLYGLIVALILSTAGGTQSCWAECYNPCCPTGKCVALTDAGVFGACPA